MSHDDSKNISEDAELVGAAEDAAGLAELLASVEEACRPRHVELMDDETKEALASMREFNDLVETLQSWRVEQQMGERPMSRAEEHPLSLHEMAAEVLELHNVAEAAEGVEAAMGAYSEAETEVEEGFEVEQGFETDSPSLRIFAHAATES